MLFWKRKKDREQFIPVALLISSFKEMVELNQEKFDDYQTKRLERFFNPDGSLIVKKIKQPNGNIIEVPLLSLVNNKLLSIGELSMTMNLNLNSYAKEQLKHQVATESANGVRIEIAETNNDDEVIFKMAFDRKSE